MAEAPQRKRMMITGTDEMISDLIQCKSTAKELVKKDHPSCGLGERKLGYMELMKQLWEVKGYECLVYQHKICAIKWPMRINVWEE